MKGAATLASKLLARKQKQQTQYVPQNQKMENPDSDQENDDGDEFNDATALSFPQPKQKGLASIRQSMIRSSPLSISVNDVAGHTNEESIKSPEPLQHIPMATSRSSIAPRGTVASPAPRSTLLQATSRSTLQAAPRSTLLAVQSLRSGGDGGDGAFSQSNTDDLMGQYMLAEKNKHLKRMKDDNDKLAALLKDIMDAKNNFLREMSWIQMNKDNIKASESYDVEQKVAMKLSTLQDESEHFENEDTRELYQQLTNFVSAVRLAQSDLTTLLLSKLEEAEEVLLGKDEKSIATTIDSLKDATTCPLLSTRNLTALLSEKLSKKSVITTKETLTRRTELLTINETSSTLKKVPKQPHQLQKLIDGNDSLSLSDIYEKLRSGLSVHVTKLVEENTLSSDFSGGQKTVLVDHIITCSSKRIISECSNLRDIIDDVENLLKVSSVRAIVFSETTIALTFGFTRNNIKAKEKSTTAKSPMPTISKPKVTIAESSSSLLPPQSPASSEGPRYMAKRKSMMPSNA